MRRDARCMGVVSETEKYYNQTVVQKTALYKIKTIKNGTIRHIIVFFIHSHQSLIDVELFVKL